jgi:hypothetical protein
MPSFFSGVYNPNDKTLTEAIGKERRDRVAEINAAWDYAYGNHKAPLRRGQESNVTLNLCGIKADRIVGALDEPELELPNGIEAEPDPQDGRRIVTLKSPAQQGLEDWLERQEFSEFIHDTVMTGVIAGHIFLKLYVNRYGELNVALLDPRTVTVIWNETDVKDVLFYRLEWQVGQERRVQDIVPSELVPEGGAEGWYIIEYRQGQNGLQETARDLWPYDFAPIIDWKNAHNPLSYYGRADLDKSVRALNDSVNFVASNTAKIIKVHASPRTIVTGGKLDMEQQTAPDVAITFESKDVSVYNLEMTSDLGSSMRFLESLRAAFFAEGRVVDISSVRDHIGTLTNFGVRMLFHDMTKLVSARRRLYGNGIAEMARRVGVIMGWGDEAPACHWGEFLPTNRIELVQALKTEIEIGTTSKQTAAADLGRDYPTETERMAEEQNDATSALTDTLTALGTGGLF